MIWSGIRNILHKQFGLLFLLNHHVYNFFAGHIWLFNENFRKLNTNIKTIYLTLGNFHVKFIDDNDNEKNIFEFHLPKM